VLIDILGPPVQIAYVVDDVWEAADRFAARFGGGPFFVNEHIPVTDVVHRGRPGSFDHSSAYGQWGTVMVELVVQHDDRPSAVRDMYAPGEGGLHHLAYIVPDLDETARRLTEQGYPQAQIATAGGGTRFAFHDATTDLGHMLELYEPRPGLLAFYAMVAEAAQGWDGSDPVRRVGG
jgi:catechol 2,3-dioxygenase-like lactoylglutathione lyase family enzyme